MRTKKIRKLKLTKESVKRLGTKQLAQAKGGTDTWDLNCDMTFDIMCVTITLTDSADELCWP